MLIRLFIMLILLAVVVFIAILLSSKKTLQSPHSLNTFPVKHVVGVSLIILSALFIVPISLQWLFSTNTTPNLNVLGFFVVSAAFGFFLVITSYYQRRRQQKKNLEQTLLNLIHRYNGRVTAVDIAMNSELCVEEAEQLLTTLCRHKKGQMQLAPDGKTVYVFYDF